MRQATSRSTTYRQPPDRRDNGSVFIMLIVVWIGALILFGVYYTIPHTDDVTSRGTSCEARYQWRIDVSGSEEARAALESGYTECVDNAG